MQTPMKSGKLDAAFREESSSTKLTRVTEKKNVALQVRKALATNCRDLSHEEIDVVRVGGVTLRERLTQDKERDNEGDKVVFGKRYYASLKAKIFESQSH